MERCVNCGDITDAVILRNREICGDRRREAADAEGNGARVEGHRVADGTLWEDLSPGSYAKLRHGRLWAVCAPNGDMGTISSAVHDITEHDDGSITVSPSIKFSGESGWHGYLNAGVWSAVR